MNPTTQPLLDLPPSFGPKTDGVDDSTQPTPELDDVRLAPRWRLIAQIYALHRSMTLPDNPYPNGIVNCIVQGVTLHHA